MNADQAFSNLIAHEKLAIPVASAAVAEDTRRAAKPTSAEPTPEPLPVLEKLTADPLPTEYSFDQPEPVQEFVFTRPTETDLDAVPECDSGENVHAMFVPEARDDDIEELAPAEFELGRGLGRSRQVKRFSFLPLQDMDRFESEARDMMARLTALNPEMPSLAITSAKRCEGRTELAIRLALAMAKRVGFKVLLCDFDVRKPAIATRLGVSSQYFTLVDVLRGSCPLNEALFYSRDDNLYFLPARQSDREGDEVLDSRQVDALIGEIHQEFDFALFDCGPVVYSDAVLLSRLAGSTALAGRGGKSTAKLMNIAASRLAATGARVSGMILTGVT